MSSGSVKFMSPDLLHFKLFIMKQFIFVGFMAPTGDEFYILDESSKIRRSVQLDQAGWEVTRSMDGVVNELIVEGVVVADNMKEATATVRSWNKTYQIMEDEL